MAALSAALLMAALAPVTARAATASAARRVPLKMIWGPNVLPNGQSAFPTYHRLGVQVYEVGLLWDDVAYHRPRKPKDPRDRVYHWPAYLNQVVSQARKYHISVCLLVERTPQWANGGRDTTWAPNKASDFANFLVAASKRYPSVHFWMIEGETNRNPTFYPMPANSPVGPRRYAILLDAAYGALKSVSRSNIVIGGNTMTYGTVHPPDFLRWMRLPNGKPPRLDYFGHNPYSDRFPNIKGHPYHQGVRDLSDIDTLEAQLRSTYHRTVPLWISEWSISSDHPNRAFTYFVSQKDQAKWLTGAFRLVDRVNYVAGLGWYDLLDEPPTVPGNLTTGLLTSTLTPKPAFFAYQRAP